MMPWAPSVFLSRGDHTPAQSTKEEYVRVFTVKGIVVVHLGLHGCYSWQQRPILKSLKPPRYLVLELLVEKVRVSHLFQQV